MNRISTSVIAAAAVVGVGLTGASPALADGTPSPQPTGARLAAIQQHGESAIASRLASLQAATTRVQDANDVSAADQTQLLAGFSNDAAGLTALRTKLAADSTVAAAAADLATIFSEYRIYAVVLPRAIIALGADRLSSTAVPRLQAAHDKLAAAGADATQLAAMQSDISSAATDVSGLSASALALTPAQYNANHTVVTPLRSRLQQAISSLRQAVVVARTLLRAGSASGSSTSAPSASATQGVSS